MFPITDSHPAPMSDESIDIDPNELRRALNDLPESYRTPVILFYFENFTYRDIADQMDLPIGTVMSRLSRAKAFLRERLMSEPQKAEGQS
jgi:RNA polymerase sigma factor (sigma-70 family)